MKKKILATLLIGVLAVGGLTACTEVTQVSYNVSQEADNFNVLRRFAVINTRTDKVEFELIGAFSLQVENSHDNQIEIVVEQADGSYKKHIVGMNENTMYVVEDLGGAKVNKYKYEVNYIPETIVPFTVKSED
nr:MAG TPA: protein of unknown function (DUF4969) [Caudoviricetes sp.]